MCDFYNICIGCPLDEASGGEYCCEWEEKHLTEAIAIVEKWSNEHPHKTYKDDLLEKFPNAILDDGAPNACVYVLYGTIGRCYALSCKECWNQPISEVE